MTLHETGTDDTTPEPDTAGRYPMEFSEQLKLKLDTSLRLLCRIHETHAQTESDRRYKRILERSVTHLRAQLSRN